MTHFRRPETRKNNKWGLFFWLHVRPNPLPFHDRWHKQISYKISSFQDKALMMIQTTIFTKMDSPIIYLFKHQNIVNLWSSKWEEYTWLSRMRPRPRTQPTSPTSPTLKCFFFIVDNLSIPWSNRNCAATQNSFCSLSFSGYLRPCKCLESP